MIVRELEKQESKPIVHVENGKPVAVIEEGDVVIFFNYRKGNTLWILSGAFFAWMWPRCMNRKGLIHFANI